MKQKITMAATVLVGSFCLAMQSQAAATLMGNVHGYTLSKDHLQEFSGLVFDSGKVIATGDGALLRKRYPDAKYLDGGGATLLPGLIDAHGHVFSLGYKSAQIDLDGTESLGAAQERVRTFLQIPCRHRLGAGRRLEPGHMEAGALSTRDRIGRGCRGPPRGAGPGRRPRDVVEHPCPAAGRNIQGYA